MEKRLALYFFELYCQYEEGEYEIDEEENAEDITESIRDDLHKNNYHIEVDEVEGIYRLRHIVRAEGINILVAEKEVFGRTVIKHKEWII